MYLPAGISGRVEERKNMFRTASKRIEDGRKEIEIMKKTGEKIRPICSTPEGER